MLIPFGPEDVTSLDAGTSFPHSGTFSINRDLVGILLDVQSVYEFKVTKEKLGSSVGRAPGTYPGSLGPTFNPQLWPYSLGLGFNKFCALCWDSMRLNSADLP